MKAALLLLLPLLFFACSGEKEQKKSSKKTTVANTGPGNVENSGLLLGVSTAEGTKTYWLVYEEGRVMIKGEVPYIASPQLDSFTYVNEVRAQGVKKCMFDGSLYGLEKDSTEEECTYEYSKIVTADNWVDFRQQEEITKAKLQRLANEKVNCGEATEVYESLKYVGTGIYSMRYGMESTECSPGPGGGESKDTVVSLTDKMWTTLLKRRIEKNVLDSMYRVLRQELVYESDEDLDVNDFVSKGLMQINVYRHRGHVIMDAMNHLKSYSDEPSHLSAKIGPAPESIAPNNYFPFDVDSLASSYPDMSDAFVSPGGELLFIYAKTKEKLWAYSIQSGKEVFTMDVKGSPVMVEWCGADKIEAWDNEINVVKELVEVNFNPEFDRLLTLFKASNLPSGIDKKALTAGNKEGIPLPNDLVNTFIDATVDPLAGAPDAVKPGMQYYAHQKISIGDSLWLLVCSNEIIPVPAVWNEFKLFAFDNMGTKLSETEFAYERGAAGDDWLELTSSISQSGDTVILTQSKTIEPVEDGLDGPESLPLEFYQRTLHFSPVSGFPEKAAFKKTPNPNGYKAIIAITQSSASDVSEDWGFFLNDIGEAFAGTKVKVQDYYEASEDVIVKVKGTEQYVNLTKLVDGQTSGYVFVWEGKDPEFSAYDLATTTIKKAKAYFKAE
jgi:hypothetical protein